MLLVLLLLHFIMLECLEGVVQQTKGHNVI